jgi:serine protease AprX
VVRGLAGLVAAAAALTSVGVAGPAAAATYDPAADVYSMAATTANTGATAWWNAGYTGRGMDVAVIDTGGAPVPDLNYSL